MTKTLICFTGGMDSSYLLWKLLKTTEEEIVALRVHFIDKDHFEDRAQSRSRIGHWDYRRIQAESLAAGRVVSWLKKNTRFFVYDIIEIDCEGEEDYHSSGHFAVREVGKYVKDKQFDRVVYGREPHHIIPEGGLMGAKEREDILRKASGGQVSMEYPLMDWHQGKAHIITSMPSELLALVTSCSHPTIIDGSIIPCDDTDPEGKCSGCSRRADTVHLLNQGIRPDVVLDLHMRRIGVGPYGNLSNGDYRYRKRRI